MEQAVARAPITQRARVRSPAGATSETTLTWKTTGLHTIHAPIHTNKANMKGWLWRPNYIRGPGGPKASWHLSYRWGKNPKKPHPGNLSRPGSNPGALRERHACYRLLHSGGPLQIKLSKVPPTNIIGNQMKFKCIPSATIFNKNKVIILKKHAKYCISSVQSDFSFFQNNYFYFIVHYFYITSSPFAIFSC